MNGGNEEAGRRVALIDTGSLQWSQRRAAPVRAIRYIFCTF